MPNAWCFWCTAGPGWPRDIVLVLLSIGALALAATGTVLGYRRLVRSTGQQLRGQAWGAAAKPHSG